MPTTSAATSRRKLALALGLALLTLAAVAIPAVAIARSDTHAAAPGGRTVATHHRGLGESASLEDELAQVRRVTARFHSVEAAKAAGYELGWVNGILTGCISNPTAGAMGYHHSTPT